MVWTRVELSRETREDWGKKKRVDCGWTQGSRADETGLGDSSQSGAGRTGGGGEGRISQGQQATGNGQIQSRNARIASWVSRYTVICSRWLSPSRGFVGGTATGWDAAGGALLWLQHSCLHSHHKSCTAGSTEVEAVMRRSLFIHSSIHLLNSRFTYWCRQVLLDCFPAGNKPRTDHQYNTHIISSHTHT